VIKDRYGTDFQALPPGSGQHRTDDTFIRSNNQHGVIGCHVFSGSRIAWAINAQASFAPAAIEPVAIEFP
jgi:hypothetical protein